MDASSLPTPMSGLPPLPGEKPADHILTPVAPPPLSGNSSVSLLDKALNKNNKRNNQVPPIQVVAKSKHLPSKHSGHKIASRKSSRKVASRHSKGGLYYRSELLPPEIYKRTYDRRNKHLPMAFYEKDYDALAFLTTQRDDYNGLRAMLDTGRSPNMVSPSGDSLLITAVKFNAINSARLLLGRHANANALDKNGMTALAIAKQRHNFPMQRALEEMGASTPRVVSSNQ